LPNIFYSNQEGITFYIRILLKCRYSICILNRKCGKEIDRVSAKKERKRNICKFI